jgi:methylmalonyl-CoA mutase C-terminal domain/subunit
LKEKGLGDILVFAGGIIPDDDAPALQGMGIQGIFGPGTSAQEITEFVAQHVKRD